MTIPLFWDSSPVGWVFCHMEKCAAVEILQVLYSCFYVNKFLVYFNDRVSLFFNTNISLVLGFPWHFLISHGLPSAYVYKNCQREILLEILNVLFQYRKWWNLYRWIFNESLIIIVNKRFLCDVVGLTVREEIYSNVSFMTREDCRKYMKLPWTRFEGRRTIL